MKKISFILPFLLIAWLISWGCSSNQVGKVVSETGNNSLHVKYTGQKLKVGDRVRIIQMETESTGEYASLAKKKVIGEGRVSTILEGNFYEIKTETAQHVPTGAIIEKL